MKHTTSGSYYAIIIYVIVGCQRIFKVSPTADKVSETLLKWYDHVSGRIEEY